jgi:hypothetical protein
MIDGNISGMRFYPPEIINPAKGFTDSDVIDVSISENFINPQKNTITQLNSDLANLISTCAPGINIKVDRIREASENVKNKSLLEFTRHTDRLTGQIPVGTLLPVDVVSPEGRNVPYLYPLNAIGKTNTYLNYINTGQRSEEILNQAYGSLFIDLGEYSNTVIFVQTKVTANIEPALEPPPEFVFNMSEEYASYLANTLNDLCISLDQSRTDDENTYVGFVSSITSGSGNTGILGTINSIQTSLIQEFQTNADTFNNLL